MPPATPTTTPDCPSSRGNACAYSSSDTLWETYIALAASVGNSAASRTAFAETSAQTAPWPSRCARRRLG
jgi:hypothetical protein